MLFRACVASLRQSSFGCSVGAYSGGSASRIRRRPRPALAWRRRPLLPALSLASCSKHKSRGSSSLRSLPTPPPVTASFRSLPQPCPVTAPSAPFRRHRQKLPPVSADHIWQRRRSNKMAHSLASGCGGRVRGPKIPLAKYFYIII